MRINYIQPWEAFHPDGVIIFSYILTPPPAFGVPFDIEEVVSTVRNKCPKTPLALYINGNGERMMRTGVDVIGLDWTVDMEDGRKRLGKQERSCLQF
ncbi:METHYLTETRAHYDROFOLATE:HOMOCYSTEINE METHYLTRANSFERASE RELATED [Salix viminalis]|uniref:METHYLTETRAHYDROFOLATE:HOMOCYSTEINE METHYLTRANSFERASE RELATED n=1 Tax=Salix viminalis TaxID=40686 RepID=A0A9Q0U713_SALVM|nr:METHYLTETRAHYDROFOLATE:HOMOCYSTEINE METHYLTRANSFERASE RELATED [Salix viminalis]